MKEKEKEKDQQSAAEKTSGTPGGTTDINKTDKIKRNNVYDSCPHCGRELSPWEKVLLSVDRMLMCKNCWYRIVLNVLNEDKK